MNFVPFQLTILEPSVFMNFISPSCCVAESWLIFLFKASKAEGSFRLPSNTTYPPLPCFFIKKTKGDLMSIPEAPGLSMIFFARESSAFLYNSWYQFVCLISSQVNLEVSEELLMCTTMAASLGTASPAVPLLQD